MNASLRYLLSAILSWVIAINLLLFFRFFGHSNLIIDWKLELIGFNTSAIALGLFFSIIDMYVNKTKIRQHSFMFIVLVKSSVFLFAILAAILLTVFFVSLARGNISMTIYLRGLERAFPSSQTLVYIIYSIIVSILFYYHRQVTRKIGPRKLIYLLMGRYHKPREENRIVMFLDLTSSTKIAEKLGAYKYSLFLKDFFIDIDDAIIDSKGSAVQFVGDEVMVVWDEKRAIENNNCIRLFFLAQEKIQASKDKYMENYGFIPKFKAGVHYGKVIVAQVGGTKQEIAYHGDTVNTAARIRSECSVVKEKLLVSSDLISLLCDIDCDFTVDLKGIFSLKGKDNVIGLFNVKEKNHSGE